MGPLAIRRMTRRYRGRAAGLLVVFAIAAGIALHHSDLAMGGMHHDGMGPTAMELCLGAFTAIGAAVVAVALSLLAHGRWRTPPPGPIRGAAFRRPPQARARAGPPQLQLLGVLRL